MSTTFDATVPEGLTELLEEFAIAVLRERPKDLVEFAARYFQNLHMSCNQQEQGGGERPELPVTMDMGDSEWRAVVGRGSPKSFMG